MVGPRMGQGEARHSMTEFVFMEHALSTKRQLFGPFLGYSSSRTTALLEAEKQTALDTININARNSMLIAVCYSPKPHRKGSVGIILKAYDCMKSFQLLRFL